MELQLDYDGITDGTTMAQGSTLVPSWGRTLSCACSIMGKHPVFLKMLLG